MGHIPKFCPKIGCHSNIHWEIEKKTIQINHLRTNTYYLVKQEAFEKCWAHSPLRAAARRLF